MNSEHLEEFKCDNCASTFSFKKDLEAHFQINHRSVKVALIPVNILKCTECEYTCALNIQLKKHIEKMHIKEKRFKCKDCNFSSEVINETWEHSLSEHINPTFSTNEMLKKNSS